MLQKIYVNYDADGSGGNAPEWTKATRVYTNVYKLDYDGGPLWHIDCDSGYKENITPLSNPTIYFYGSIVNSSWSAVPGKVFRCDHGSSHQFRVINNLDISKNNFTLTYSCQMRDKPLSGYDYIMRTEPHGILLYASGNNLYLRYTRLNSEGSTVRVYEKLGSYNDWFPDNTWRNVVLTWDYARLEYSLYINAEKATSVRTNYANVISDWYFVESSDSYLQNRRYFYDPRLFTFKYTDTYPYYIKYISKGKGKWREANRVYVNKNGVWTLVLNAWG